MSVGLHVRVMGGRRSGGGADPADAERREGDETSRLHMQKPLCLSNLGLLNKPS